MTQHRMQARAGRPWFEERDLEVMLCVVYIKQPRAPIASAGKKRCEGVGGDALNINTIYIPCSVKYQHARTLECITLFLEVQVN